MKHRYDRTISILINAFFKGELRHGMPCNCAVGNLIQVYQGFVGSGWVCDLWGRRYSPALASLPFTLEEILAIEAAFEDRVNFVLSHSCMTDPDGFKGLCSVFDCLEKLEPEYFVSKKPLLEMVEELA